MDDDRRDHDAYDGEPRPLAQSTAGELVRRALDERPALLRRLLIGEVVAQRIANPRAARGRRKDQG